jgi:predicted RNase H-like HicB family nuclease
MNFRIELEQEQDGRWIAEVVDIPGVLVYGASREEAIHKAQALALRVVAEKLDLGEVTSMPLTISFLAA